MPTYTADYFEIIKEGAARSAEVIVPLLLELIQPRRVIDIGCGPGTWLAAFQRHGACEVWGVDGDYLSEEQLDIPRDRFIAWDLTKPLQLQQRFDLAMSLEAAEHLPEACAGDFVASLTRLAPVVLFSAAIPHQGGRHHINEQWPYYWVELFRNRDYCVIDCLRKKVWDNQQVEWWYAQNILLFVDNQYVKSRPGLQKERDLTNETQLALVHPKKYLELIAWSVREIEGLYSQLNSK